MDTIDDVIAHELCHMAEPHHGAAFYRLLYRVMPDWAGRKGRLEERMARGAAGLPSESRSGITV